MMTQQSDTLDLERKLAAAQAELAGARRELDARRGGIPGPVAESGLRYIAMQARAESAEREREAMKRVAQTALDMQRAAQEYAAQMERERDEYKRDAERWETIFGLWCASTELHMTQDEDGRWSITIIEPVEALPLPGKWTGDDPNATIDAIAAREAK